MSDAQKIPDIFNRCRNFRDFKEEMWNNPSFIEDLWYLQLFVDDISEEIRDMRSYDNTEKIIEQVIAYVTAFVTLKDDRVRLFEKDEECLNDILDALCFMTIALFLHNTNRIKGESLRSFIYNKSRRGFNDKGSKNYFDFDKTSKEFVSSSSDSVASSIDINSEEGRLKEYMNRLKIQRPVKIESKEGAAMSADSAHEWSLYFLTGEDVYVKNVQEENKIYDIQKRIKNLYNGIYEILKNNDVRNLDELELESELEIEIKKSRKKVSKVKYEEFLQLNEYYLKHIEGNKSYYGINLYRFEKQMRFYNITKEVNRLLECRTENEENELLPRFWLLRDITFSRVYEAFYKIKDYTIIDNFVKVYLDLRDRVVFCGRLVIDKFVEEGLFGESWPDTFRKYINNLAPFVLYNPKDVDCCIREGSQAAFEKILYYDIVRNTTFGNLIKMSKYQIQPIDIDQSDQSLMNNSPTISFEGLNMDKQNYRTRIIDRKVDEYLAAFGAVCIEGPKWCGKTWTSAYHSKSEIYIGGPAENLQNRQLARLSPSLVLEGETPRLIDEWQEVPPLWDAVRYKVDETPQKGLFILTGSATPNRKGILHSEPGQIGRLRMRPMSLYESGDSSGKVSLEKLCHGELTPCLTGEVDLRRLIELIVRGGWPESLGLPLDKTILLPGKYLDVVVGDEVYRMDGAKRDTQKMRLLLRSLTRNESTTATKQALIRDIKNVDNEEIDPNTVATYLDILKRLFITDNQLPFPKGLQFSIRVKQTEKRHLADPSLACALLKATPSGLLGDLETLGFLFEALCERDLRIYADSFGAGLYHYQDYSNREIDAVIELTDGSWCAFEIKLGANQIDAAAENLLAIKRKFEEDPRGRPPAVLCVLCGLANAAYRRQDGVFVVPITALKD